MLSPRRSLLTNMTAISRHSSSVRSLGYRFEVMARHHLACVPCSRGTTGDGHRHDHRAHLHILAHSRRQPLMPERPAYPPPLSPATPAPTILRAPGAEYRSKSTPADAPLSFVDSWLALRTVDL